MFAVFLFSVLSECSAGKKVRRIVLMQMFCGRGRITICLKQLQETLYQISLEKKKETKKLKKVFNDVGLTSLTTLNNFKGSLNLLYLGIETLDGSLHNILSLCNLIDWWIWLFLHAEMPFKNKMGRSRANKWYCWELIQVISSLIIAVERKRELYVTRYFLQMAFFLVLDILWFVVCAAGTGVSFGLLTLLTILKGLMEEHCSLNAEGTCHCSGEYDVPMNSKLLIHNVRRAFASF